jgi:replicative DNA helicase
LVPQQPVKAFSNGIKPVCSLKTRLNYAILATGNHRFFTRQGWKALDDLQLQEEIAVAVGEEIVWDPISEISDPMTAVEVFDLEMPRHHNFLANQILVHNSIEQDADIVMMLYRPEYYDPNTGEKGIAEIILAKHRNGPTGTVKMLFENQFTQFRNLADPNR